MRFCHLIRQLVIPNSIDLEPCSIPSPRGELFVKFYIYVKYATHILENKRVGLFWRKRFLIKYLAGTFNQRILKN